MMDSL